MNLLSQESSPYLLQHKNNPVHWVPWSEAAFEEAARSQKLVLVSIGYSACHWCHVMEHECFEDEQVAALMNKHFVCIKVDREERPDVDKAYMEAVQLMNKQGGWPLNCFTLPNKQPFFGGTYFPKDRWMGLLSQIVKLQDEQSDKIVEFAEQVTQGVGQSLQIYGNQKSEISLENLMDSIKKWKTRMDYELGGFSGAPKFPLPVAYRFLLNYGLNTRDTEVLDQVHLTLTEMCRGGIYDQIGGGFARYSVDDYWKVPHFEKMLYDNAQLIGLYAKGAQVFKEEEFALVVTETVSFLKRELLTPDGLFQSALDADSEGEEGKFYIWSHEELEELLDQETFEKASFYYNFNAFGEWEGNYIPLKQMSDQAIAKEWGVSKNEVVSWSRDLNAQLLERRSTRVRPGTDTKVLCSWNALLIVGLLEAFESMGNDEHRTMALKCLDSLWEKYYDVDKALVFRTFRSEQPIHGFLEDYAGLASALFKAYLVTTEENYLIQSKQIVDTTLDRFFDAETRIFHFSEIQSNELFTAQTDFIDDVTPSANALLGHVLYDLAVIFGNEHYGKIAHELMHRAANPLLGSPYNFSHWCDLFLKMEMQREIVIVGKEAHHWKTEIKQILKPTDVLLLSTSSSGLPIFQDRFTEGKTRIFVCENKTCGLPIEDLQEALNLLK